MAIVWKQDAPEIIARQLHFFASMPSGFVPSNVSQTGPDSYDYKWVHGEEASSFTHVKGLLEMMPRVVWGRDARSSSLLVKGREQYIQYVMAKVRYMFGSGTWGVIEDILVKGILHSGLSWARQVHGDLTMENVIVKPDGGEIVLIDPGHPRGLCCEELDISKLMQSVTTHWEMAKGKRVHRIAFDNTWKIKPSTLALLLSHWVRILSHPEKHSACVLSYGTRVVIPAIIAESEGKDWKHYATSDGSGWGSDRLSQRCLRGL